MNYIYYFLYIFILKTLICKPPKISIFLPINKQYEKLKLIIDNLIKQTLKNIEIIIINNDFNLINLDNIIQYMFDNRIILLNVLYIKNNFINQGLDFAMGEYITFIEPNEPNDFININMFKNIYNLTENGFFDIIRSNYNFKLLKN